MRILMAVVLSAATLAGARAQSAAEAVEKEFVGPWLYFIETLSRSRVLEVRDVATRSDGSFMLDAKLGWTLGGASGPVLADLTGAAGRYALTLNMTGGGVVTAKQTAPGVFAGTFVASHGTRALAVEIRKATREQVAARIRLELEESRKGEGFAHENKDWGVAETTAPQTDRPHAPTPRTLKGARTVTTLELYHALNNPGAPVLLDVLDGKHQTIRGAHWLPNAGRTMGRAEMSRLGDALGRLSKGDKTAPLVFFCLNSECWLSYNAALRALELGYTNVAWYRGGTAAWIEAGYAREETRKEAW
jgi:PQQ-dependent catabolism-associated CXXCW motif protein